MALRGGNGSGKTSLLRLILGEDISRAGEVRVASGLIISYVPQDPSFLSGALQEYIDACGVDGTLMRAILRKLDFARVQFEKDLADLSAGQKKKVLIARSLCERAHLYVWDEPLNYIDVLSRMQIEELITEYEPTMLFVEHDAAFLENVATRIFDLSGGNDVL
jgi:lincosamide and streptogramin A transport system ATP-binding/permease protein